MKLESVVHPELALVLGPIEGAGGLSGRDAVLAAVAAKAASHTPGIGSERLLAALLDREATFPTGTPEGVAFPHALLAQIERTFVVPTLVPGGVKWSSQPHGTQDLVFAIFGSSETPWEHVRLLARLARIIKRAGAASRLRAAASAEELLSVLIEEDRSHG